MPPRSDGYLRRVTTHTPPAGGTPAGRPGDMTNTARNTAEQMAEGHPGRADRGVSGAARMVGERTGDTYDAKTDGASRRGTAVPTGRRRHAALTRYAGPPRPRCAGAGGPAQPGAPARPTT
ncbi:Rv0909 family putative TA system antitoxin [Streptomyces kanasensis]|uniref:Rv0909 family putative TA system antitoxin n=1 Tax=Streptomyces kanasensis TaxID=936756 RepID=UPI0036FBFA50